MALLFCDGFEDGLTAQKWTTTSISTPASSGRVSGLAMTFDNGGDSANLNLATPVDTVIVGFAYKLLNFNPAPVVSLYADSGGSQHITVAVQANGALTIRRGAYSGTLLATSNTLLTVGAWYYIELKVKVADSGGTAELHIDGKVAATFTGDTKNGGTSALIDLVAFVRNSGGVDFSVDDFYACDNLGSTNNNFLGDVRIETIYPNGNGNSSQLVGSDADSVDNYQLVDETTPSTTDYVASGTVGQKDTYTFTNLAAATGPIMGVQLTSYANKTDAAARDIINVTRSGGVEADSASRALQTTYTTKSTIQETNPNGGGAWTITDVNNAEFGVKVN